MGYSIHHSPARLLFHKKREYQNGEIVEWKAWEVPRSAARPEGFKYSMVYIDVGGRRILGYDNAEGKGDHRHVGDEETPFAFEGLDLLLVKFLDEVGRLRGRHQ
ncbi:MAG: DUF6516 family protein [Elusimicrobiota bacterium]